MTAVRLLSLLIAAGSFVACSSLTLEIPESEESSGAGVVASSATEGSAPGGTRDGGTSASPGETLDTSANPASDTSGGSGATAVVTPGETATSPSGVSGSGEPSPVPSVTPTPSDPIICGIDRCGLREGERCDNDENPCAPGLWCPDGVDEAVQRCAPELVFEGDVAMRFIRIPAGTFLQGTPPPNDANRRQWESTLTRPYYLAEVPVTQAQWAALTRGAEGSPAHNTAGPEGPVERVSWYEALVFANRVSEAAGLEPCYAFDQCFGDFGAGCAEGVQFCSLAYECLGLAWDRECDGYRLPTESEWERALRAGAESYQPFFWGSSTDQEVVDAHVWYQENTDNKAPKVGRLLPNPWGLHDMAGTISEWVYDTWGAYPNEPRADHVAASGVTSSYVTRGGGYSGTLDHMRSFYRSPRVKTSREAQTGFRLARTAPR